MHATATQLKFIKVLELWVAPHDMSATQKPEAVDEWVMVCVFDGKLRGYRNAFSVFTYMGEVKNFSYLPSGRKLDQLDVPGLSIWLAGMSTSFLGFDGKLHDKQYQVWHIDLVRAALNFRVAVKPAAV